MMRAMLLSTFLLGVALGGCEGGEGPAGPQGPEGPGAPSASTVEVSPTSLFIDDGETVELAATVLADDGSSVDGAAVTWTSDDADVATLSPLSGATVSPDRVLVTGAGSGSTTVTATVGSASSGASVTCCFPAEPDVAFAVRSGTTINPTGSPGIFDDDTDEAFLEFALDFPEGSTVTLEFRVFDFVSGPDDPVIEFSVATYEANGSADASDFGSGTSFDTFSMGGELGVSFSVDVTAEVNAIRDAGATHIGFRFYDSTFSQLSVQPEASLEGS